MAGFIFGDYLLSMYWYGVSSFYGFIWFISFFFTYGVSFDPLRVGYRAMRILNPVG
jgi:hypothetical protein